MLVSYCIVLQDLVGRSSSHFSLSRKYTVSHTPPLSTVLKFITDYRLWILYCPLIIIYCKAILLICECVDFVGYIDHDLELIEI